jgi:hypothetical protein
MPANEIKELRKSGKLDEAYKMAKAELDEAMAALKLTNAETGKEENFPADLTWPKRNMSWVLYSQLDAVAADFPNFLLKLEELKQLNLPESETMFFENLPIVISKAVRNLSKENPVKLNRVHQLFDEIKNIPFIRKSKWFSVMFSAFHKGMKESDRYIEFADWWNFENFLPEDFQKDKLPNGTEVIAIVEQAYIAYAKHLLPKQHQGGEVEFNKEKVLEFLSKLTNIVDNYPQFQYPGYFNAKLLLALGNNENILELLLPFVKKKQNDFWAWDILSEAFSDDEEKIFNCYCKALTCFSPEEMLVGLRQRMIPKLLKKELYNEAKTEIETTIKVRTKHEYSISNELLSWQNQDWYKNAKAFDSNSNFYKQFAGKAEELLFLDVQEEYAIVDFVNTEKSILNFIVSETKFGFFKYDRFFKNVNIGDVLKVRFQSSDKYRHYKVYTAKISKNDAFKSTFVKEIYGTVRIGIGKSFGFIEDAFINPYIINKNQFVDGQNIKATAIKTFNKEKGIWGWKMI